ncbi:hypothetical protein HZS_5204 [Henneguya salminicola]|nr:hypothetical protein HZS_5204 [Henneguya salminicola]
MTESQKVKPQKRIIKNKNPKGSELKSTKAAITKKPDVLEKAKESPNDRKIKKENNSKARKIISKKIIDRALRAKKSVLQKKTKGIIKKRIRTSVTFRRPHTLRVPRHPKYPRSTETIVPKKDAFSVIKFPVTTELCMKKLEDSNTLTFIVDNKSTKHAIKKAVKARYDVLASKVTTLNLPTGIKKAYVKLTADVDAIEVANRIGMPV